MWVKEIRTTSHNNRRIELRDLVSDDPDSDPDDKNWRNGEPDEVEVEWELLQEEFGKDGGGDRGELAAEPEDLDGGDEVVTRRYEFYEYIGPMDLENGEAKADKVGPDGIHGEGVKTINDVEVDLSTVEVVGEFKGAQMAAVEVDAAVGLIEHVGEGAVGEAYAARRVVVEGAQPFLCEQTGDLPAGMSFDEVTGILGGTPEESGQFQFAVSASDAMNPEGVSKNYTLVVAAAGLALPPSSLVDTSASPAAAGTTTGDGAFETGSEVTVVAAPAPGFRFVNWTDNGAVVSQSASYTFTLDINHTLVANFAEAIPLAEITLQRPAAPGDPFSLLWPTDPPGWTLEESADLKPGSWKPSERAVEVIEGNSKVSVQPIPGESLFFRLSHP
ncbi:MAG: putative Ig domain-containing protein [Verrucomicrobiales bacterium]